MCKVQMLRALVKQRLTAAAEEIFGLFERTIAEYEEELSRSKEENERQRKLLDAVFSPQLRLHRAVFPADVQQLLMVKEEVPPEQQDQEEPEPPHSKEEQAELCTSQEGEQLQGLEEADITAVPVKSEDDEAQSSQLHHRLTEQMETEADGEDCGGPEPARNSHTHTHLQPETEDKTEDKTEVSSDPETDDSADWKETREPQSGSNSLKNEEVPVSVGEKPFSCPECEKRFVSKSRLKEHLRCHTGEKPYRCSVCNKKFSWRAQIKKHKCAGRQSSQLHRSETEENREAEPPASSSAEQMETEADGEDCVGPEPARNSHTHTHLQPATHDKTGVSSDPETDDSADWKETREPEKVPVSDSGCIAGEKPFSCSECGLRFLCKTYLKIHLKSHTGEKPYSCLVCGKRYYHKGHVNQHMRSHTTEKPYSCSVCGNRYHRRDHLIEHMRCHTGEKPYSCSVCNRNFTWRSQIKNHKCVGHQSSPLHQSQTEENREAEPPASSSAEQMETEADGEDCGGPEPARNSHTHTHLQPETEDKAGDFSDPETDDSVDWKETSEPQSGSNSQNVVRS